VGGWLDGWTVGTSVDRLDSADGGHVAIVDGGVRMTVNDLRTRSARVAATLHERGVRHGEIVCWQLPNWWEAVVLCWAIWRCGAIASPITPTLRARELGFILGATGARCVAVPSAFRGTDHLALLDEAGFAGDALVVRGDESLPES